MTLPSDIDQPEVGSISIRVYPAAASASVSAQPSTTKVVYQQVPLSPVPQLPGAFSGVTGFATHLTTPVASKQTVGPQTTITSGSFGQGCVELTKFNAYDYDENYLTPADGWSFTLSALELSTNDRNAILPGSKVEILIDGQLQSTGYVDHVRSHGSRSAGANLTIEGRDWLSSAVDGHVDPQTRLKQGMTLDQALTAIFAPFGVSVQAVDNLANRNAITGAIYGTPTSKKGKALKSFVLHELKPYQAEGAFAFASRISQRFGLWIRPAVDSKTIVVAQPDFDQPARYSVTLKTDGSQNNNVEDWDVKTSRADQPTIIFGSGFGGGGEFPKSSLRGAIINPLIALGNPDIVAQLMASYPGLVATTPPAPAIVSAIGSIMLDPCARPLYLYDSESKTPEQLQAFLRRELALRMRKSLTAKYSIAGHRLGGQPVAVDTIANVDDDVSNVHGPLWMIGRTFSKTAGEQGTKSSIEFIRPGTLLFGPGGNS